MKTFAISLIFAGLCHAQTTGGIHAPVTRNVSIPPDEATFNLTVTASLDSTVRQVKEALQNVGALNPTVVATGVGGPNPLPNVRGGPQMFYSARFTLPAASSSDVAKGLLNLSAHLPQPLISLQMSVSYAASEAKVEAVRQSLLPGMRDEAQKTAERIALATGVRLGALRAVSDNPGAMYLLGGGISTTGSRLSLILAQVPIIVPYTFRLELVFDTLP